MRSLVATIALLTTASPLRAQQTPTQTVQTALDAIARHDWRTLSNLVDSTRLVEFRRKNLGLLVEWAQRKDEIAAAERTTGSWGFSGIDSLTVAVIERVKDQHLPAFEGQTIGALAQLSPREFYERFTDAANRRDAIDPVGVWSSLKRRVVGELTVGDTMAYVIYRREGRQIFESTLYHYLPGQAEIAPLRREASGWKLLLHDDLQHDLAIFSLVPSERNEPTPGRLKRDTTCATFVLPPIPTTDPKRSASDVLRAAFAADQRADWTTLAALVHPMMLANLKRELLSELIGWARERKHPSNESPSGITLIVHPPGEDTTGTLDIADVADVRVPIFRDSLSIADLAAAPPARFFALVEEAAYGDAPSPTTSGDSLASPRQIIGEITEAAGFVHVLYSGGPFRYDDRWRVTRMPLLRNGDDWGLLLNDDIGDRSAIMFALMMHDHPPVPDTSRE